MNKPREEKIEIITPPVATSDVDCGLVDLTEYMTKKLFKGEWQGGGLLGGEFGYGVDFENDTFMMKPFCWCDKDDECLWCMMNDPADNPNYDKMKSEILEKYGKWFADYGGAPNFYYKPTKQGCVWYKWIGRDTRWNKKPNKTEWKKILEDCIKSLESK